MIRYLFLVLFALPAFAFAAEENASISESRFSLSSLRKNSTASLGMLLTGGSFQSLDGKEGAGKNFNLRFYPSLGYKFTRVTSIGYGQEFRQYFRDKDPKRPNRKEFEVRDPYLGLSFYRFVNTRGFALSGKVRFYFPVTEYTKTSIGKSYDNGKGQWNAGVTPSQKFIDGDLTLSAPIDYYYRIAKNPPKVREDHSFKVSPQVSYRLNRKVDAKVEYSTGYIRHMNNAKNKWTKLNDPILGHSLSTGISWYATDNWSLSPSLRWSNNSWRLDRTEVSVYSNIAIL